MQAQSKTFLIMKVAAALLMLVLLSLIYYHSEYKENLELLTARYEITTAGPVSARPPSYPFDWLDEFKNQVVYVNFWASWCAPCREELPFLKELQVQYKNKDFKIVLINMDTENLLFDAIEIQKQLAPELFAIYKNNRHLTQTLNIQALPYHLMIDKQGRTASAFYAPLLKEKEKFISLIEQLLAEPSKP